MFCWEPKTKWLRSPCFFDLLDVFIEISCRLDLFFAVCLVPESPSIVDKGRLAFDHSVGDLLNTCRVAVLFQALVDVWGAESLPSRVVQVGTGMHSEPRRTLWL